MKEVTGKEYDPGINISSDTEYWLKKLEDFSTADLEEPVQAELIELVYKNCLEYMREHSDGNVMMRIYERLQTLADQCRTGDSIFVVYDKSKDLCLMHQLEFCSVCAILIDMRRY